MGQPNTQSYGLYCWFKMRTVLLQSFRTTDVPDWMTQCIASAQTLADANSWSYRFMGDEFFDLVPHTIHVKLSDKLAMMSDFARLAWAKDLFKQDQTVDRIIWLDADVCVFAPHLLDIDETLDFVVGRQFWIQPDQGNDLKIFNQVPNALMVFTRHSPALEFLLHSITTMAERMEQISSPQMFGPKLLTALHNIVGFDVIESVGMASPLVLRDLAQDNGQALDTLLRNSKDPLAALNLCGSYKDQTIDDVLCDDALYDRALTHLCSKQSGLAS